MSRASPSDSKTFEEPIQIVEVLSPGNTAETWESIRAVAPITSLAEILVVESEKLEVQVFRCSAAGDWQGEPEVIGSGGTVRLASIGLEMPTVGV